MKRKAHIPASAGPLYVSDHLGPDYQSLIAKGGEFFVAKPAFQRDPTAGHQMYTQGKLKRRSLGSAGQVGHVTTAQAKCGGKCRLGNRVFIQVRQQHANYSLTEILFAASELFAPKEHSLSAYLRSSAVMASRQP